LQDFLEGLIQSGNISFSLVVEDGLCPHSLTEIGRLLQNSLINEFLEIVT
jgi:hypothetical protein